MKDIATRSNLAGLEFFKSPLPGSVHGQRGAVCELLAGDKAGSAHGANLVIIDEAGLLNEGRQRELWNSCISCLSGRRQSRLIAISIRGHSPMFGELYETRHLDSVVWHEYSGDPDLPFDDEANWHLANPGLKSGIKDLEGYMKPEAERVKHTPANLNAFLAEDLNLPVSPDRTMITSVDDWRDCETAEADLPERRGTAYLGLDLGGSSSMSAAVACWRNGDSIRMEARGAFPAYPDLLKRGKLDNCGDQYQLMFDRGELKTYVGRIVDLQLFLADIRGWLKGERIVVHADRFRKAELENEMGKAGLTWPIEWRSMGFMEASRDIRGFQSAVLSGQLKIAPSLLMSSAIRNSNLVFDQSGNMKIEKGTSRGRIDALSAGVMAAAAAYSARATTRRRRVYHGTAG